MAKQMMNGVHDMYSMASLILELAFGPHLQLLWVFQSLVTTEQEPKTIFKTNYSLNITKPQL